MQSEIKKTLNDQNVGERIRDIIYNSSLNAFILAMEDTGSIGLFTPVKNDE